MTIPNATAPDAGVFAYWPNRITAIRFLGALLLFLLLGLIEELTFEPRTVMLLYGACTVLFIAVAATDWLDGWLARRSGQVTAFGRIADPFVDKILVLGSFVFLAGLPHSAQYVPTWLVVLVLARELLVTGMRGYVESLGLAFAADRWGKLKMVLQCIAIGAVLALQGFPWPQLLETGVIWLAYIAVGLTLISTLQSGLAYAFKCRALLAAHRSSA